MQKKNPQKHTHMHAWMHALTHTHKKSTHFHLIRLTYILMPHGQMIIEAQLGCFCAATESESHEWGCLCAYMCECVCVCVYCQRTERGGIDSGERMNLETWRESDGLTRARWSDSELLTPPSTPKAHCSYMGAQRACTQCISAFR